MPDLNPDEATLSTIDGFPASDSRTLAFTVVFADGSTRDISSDEIEWYLLDKPYESDSDAIVDNDSTGIEIVTDNRVDTANGEFEVRVSPDALADEWGSVHQRIRIATAGGETDLSWRGEIILTADGATA